MHGERAVRFSAARCCADSCQLVFGWFVLSCDFDNVGCLLSLSELSIGNFEVAFTETVTGDVSVITRRGAMFILVAASVR